LYNLLIRYARHDGSNFEGNVASDNGRIDPTSTATALDLMRGRPLTHLH